MTRLTSMTTAIFFALCGWSGLLSVDPARATTITDTFELKLTFKEWCQGNPAFFENFNVKTDSNNPSANTTLTITRDDSNPAEIEQARIDTHGKSADVDAITLSGKAAPSNTAASKAEFALSGVNPGNPNHFLTLRGQATLDKFGNVTKVTGTFMVQETNTYTTDKKTGTQSGPVECFASGTFTTGKEAGGTLTVVDAPFGVGGTFIANAYLTKQGPISGIMTIQWFEAKPNNVHNEAVLFGIDPNTGEVGVFFAYGDVNEAPDGFAWVCGANGLGAPCSGVTFNQSAGTLTLSDTILGGWIGTGSQITLNGTLTFRPF